MKMRNITYLSVFFLCVCMWSNCNHKPSSLKIKVVEKKPLDGYWILTDVVDSVLHHKKIVYYIAGGVQVSMILLNIEQENLEARGFWQKNQTKIKNAHTDTLGKIEKIKTYHLLFDKKRKLIKINTEYKTYLYRQLTKKELSSYGGLTDIFSLEKYLHNLYMQELLVGTYKAIDSQQEVQTFTVHPNGKIEGFKDFKEINIYMHFGTTWRFGSYDAIYSTNTKNPSDGSFTFKFNGDTLLLNNLESRDAFHYDSLGTKKFRFLKQKP